MICHDDELLGEVELNYVALLVLANPLCQFIFIFLVTGDNHARWCEELGDKHWWRSK